MQYSTYIKIQYFRSAHNVVTIDRSGVNFTIRVWSPTTKEKCNLNWSLPQNLDNEYSYLDSVITFDSVIVIHLWGYLWGSNCSSVNGLFLPEHFGFLGLKGLLSIQVDGYYIIFSRIVLHCG